jgi:hypothetical protein
LTPQDDTTEVFRVLELTWSSDTLSTHYQLQVFEGTDPVVIDTLVTDTSFTNTEPLKSNTTYNWRVNGINQSDSLFGEPKVSDWSSIYTFETGISLLSTPISEIPYEGQENVGKSVTYQWSNSESSYSYHLQVSTDSMFSSVDFEYSLIDSNVYNSSDSLEVNTQYFWRVRSQVGNDQFYSDWSDTISFTTGIRTSTEPNTTPSSFSLQQNYPNPFNPTTTITYSLPQSGMVTLNVYDITGRFITTLVDGVKGVGTHSVQFEGSSLSSGMYVYTLETDGYRQTRQMMLVK